MPKPHDWLNLGSATTQINSLLCLVDYYKLATQPQLVTHNIIMHTNLQYKPLINKVKIE